MGDGGVSKPVLLAILDILRKVRDAAYAPYSKFNVGAAAIGGSGHVYYGCNVENASFGLSVCAERVAIFKAVSEGEREIRAVVILAGQSGISSPCGACLQVISEFALKRGPLVVLSGSLDGDYEVHPLKDYIPKPF